MKKLVLLIDDDVHLHTWLKETLPKDLFLVECTTSAQQGFEISLQRKPDLILLDWDLIGINGLELCKAIRSHKVIADIPLIMLTGYRDANHKIRAFEMGVDDYLTKPFEVEELTARIKAVLRRRGKTADEIIERDGILLNATAHSVHVDRKPLVLTPMEFHLLHLFMCNPGRVFTRPYLLERVWGYSANVSSRTVDVYIVRLRKKLGMKRAATIESLRNIGYRFKGTPKNSERSEMPPWLRAPEDYPRDAVAAR
jgi:DNA-binding response OmpR family regulator